MKKKSQEKEKVSTKEIKSKHEDILKYWTEERMQEAIPLSMDLPKSDSSQ